MPETSPKGMLSIYEQIAEEAIAAGLKPCQNHTAIEFDYRENGRHVRGYHCPSCGGGFTIIGNPLLG